MIIFYQAFLQEYLISPMFLLILLKCLQKLPSSRTLSSDGFPVLFFKSIAPSIALPLSILFTQSLSNGQIPKIWKVAFVRPLFKKGLCSLPSNYRPISLSSVIGKVMEKLLVNSMMLFLQSNHLLSKNQFGFLSRRSTFSQLLAMLNDWTLAVNNHAKVDAVYIDFTKAFDSISHVKLLKRFMLMVLIQICLTAYQIFLLNVHNLFTLEIHFQSFFLCSVESLRLSPWSFAIFVIYK